MPSCSPLPSTLLAHDVAASRSALSEGDVAYRITPEKTGLWRARTIVPFHLARKLIGTEDDVERCAGLFARYCLLGSTIRPCRSPSAHRAASQRRAGASRRDRRGREGSGAALPGGRPPRRRGPGAPRLGDAGARGAPVSDRGEPAARRSSRSSQRRGEVQPRARSAACAWSPAHRGCGRPEPVSQEEAVPRARAPAILEAAGQAGGVSLAVLTPLGALLAVGVVVPLFALRQIRRRAQAARRDARRRGAGAAHAPAPAECARCRRNAPRPRCDSARLRVDTRPNRSNGRGGVHRDRRLALDARGGQPHAAQPIRAREGRGVPPNSGAALRRPRRTRVIYRPRVAAPFPDRER